jgi:hypothetical protein
MRKPQLHSGNVPEISGDNMGGATGYCELDTMIVCFVSKIGSPAEVDPRPLAMRDEDVEKFRPLQSGQPRAFE